MLGQYNIAKSDLVPVIVTYPKDTDIVYNSCKEAGALTQQQLEQDTVYALMLDIPMQ